MEFLKPSNGCAPHTRTSEMMEDTDKEVYWYEQTSLFKEKEALLGK